MMTAGTIKRERHSNEGDPKSQKSSLSMKRFLSKYINAVYIHIYNIYILHIHIQTYTYIDSVLFRSSLKSSTLSLKPGEKNAQMLIDQMIRDGS